MSLQKFIFGTGFQSYQQYKNDPNLTCTQKQSYKLKQKNNISFINLEFYRRLFAHVLYFKG